MQTIYPGASPATIEREITRRLEEAFNPVEGVDRITSITLEGVSQVIVEFELQVSGNPTRRCGLRWAHGNFVGVRFLSDTV